MARVPSDQTMHKAILMVGDSPTIDGRVYSLELCTWLADRMGRKPELIVQEICHVERRLKKISEAEPWMEKAMAVIIGAEMEGNSLVFYFRCKTSRDGKKLEGIIRQYGVESIEFYPVGYGEIDENGTVKPGYQLNYVAIDIKTEMRQPTMKDAVKPNNKTVEQGKSAYSIIDTILDRNNQKPNYSQTEYLKNVPIFNRNDKGAPPHIGMY